MIELPIGEASPDQARNFSLAIPDTGHIEKECADLVQSTRDIRVITHEEYMLAGEKVKALKQTIKMVKETFKKPKDDLNKLKNSILQAESKLVDPLEASLRINTEKVLAYDERLRIERAKEAEARRIEAEAKMKAEMEEARKKEAERQAELTKILQENGFTEEAEAVIAQPPPPIKTSIIAPAPVEEKPKVAGIHTRITYKAEVVSLIDLVKAVASGEQPLAFVQAQESALNKQASALKLEMRVPGVRVVEHRSIAQNRIS